MYRTTKIFWAALFSKNEKEKLSWPKILMMFLFVVFFIIPVYQSLILRNIKTFGISQSIHDLTKRRNILMTTNSEIIPPIDLPKALIVAGLNENELEVIDEILSEILSEIPPIVILDKSDSQSSLNTILSNEILNDRDHIIPNQGIYSKHPIIIISGFERSITLQFISNVRNRFKSISNLSNKYVLFAIVVLPALNKSFKQLLEEITRDYEDSKNKV